MWQLSPAVVEVRRPGGVTPRNLRSPRLEESIGGVVAAVTRSQGAMTRLAVIIASFGYAGYSPIAPGTAGSAAALVLYALLRWSDSPVALLIALVAVAIVGTWSASIAERYFGRTDPGQIVVDEVLGMLMTLAFVPLTWTGVIVGFFVFRALDIVKPFPSRAAEGLRAGVGVMADDAICGVYGNLIVRLLVWLLPAWM